ncbi:DUF916 domain-containing protein [Weissella confusa]|uniref:DUF916 domain-containing protein n=1 Tax=Weissella confusa TaxID=1583 RepID=UPI000ADD7B2B|nr:DUF916 domain-containing protein [Weissella confusa]
MTKLKSLLVMALTVIGVGLFMPNVHAQSSMDFVVSPKLPDTQVDKKAGFFNFQLDAGKKETLHVTISNTSGKDIKLKVSAGTAGTSAAGAVDNTMTGDAVKDVPYRMGDLLKLSKTTVTVPAGQSIDYTADFTMPDKRIVGLLVGGLRFEQVDDANTANQGGTALQTDLAYVLSVMARQYPTLPTPKVSFGGAKAAQIDGQNAVRLRLENKTGTFVNRLEAKAVVTDGMGRKVTSFTQSMMQMAPTSTMDWPVLLNGKTLKSGEYHVAITTYYSQAKDGKYKDSAGSRFNYKDTFNSSFKLTVAQAKQLNNTDMIQQAHHALPWWLWLIIIFLLIIVGLVAFIVLYFYKAKHPDAKIFNLDLKKFKRN